MKVREVIAYENHFEEFLHKQPEKVQDKIFKIIEAIETLERVPANYLKAMEPKRNPLSAISCRISASFSEETSTNLM